MDAQEETRRLGNACRSNKIFYFIAGVPDLTQKLKGRDYEDVILLAIIVLTRLESPRTV